MADRDPSRCRELIEMVRPEPVTALPPRRLARTVLTQRWRDLAFVHWPADPDAVRRLLPPGVEPDTIDGTTYVGLVAFLTAETGLRGGPHLPYVGRFAEMNVRVYSVDAAGRRGVVFLSLDAGRLAPVLPGRLAYGLPYRWSLMRTARRGDVHMYSCRRRWPASRGVTSRLAVRVGEPIDHPSGLDHFLTARWGLHASRAGRTRYTPNAHPRWTLHRVDLVDLDDGLVAAGGLPGPAGPPASLLWSPGLDVRFGPSLPA
ncbi:MAG: YqjF family protein [Carbonactinosporaceae bacterium]